MSSLPRASLLLAAVWLAPLADLGAASAQRSVGMRCAVATAVGPSFGAYDWTAAEPLDSAGYFEFRCDAVGPSDLLRIEINRGHGPRFYPRAMKRRNSKLEYNLYLDAARTRVWGDGTRGTAYYQLRPPNGVSVNLPIYGRIPPGQRVAPGQYQDTVVLTLQY